jgi:hypothetical protein
MNSGTLTLIIPSLFKTYKKNILIRCSFAKNVAEAYQTCHKSRSPTS